MQAGGTTAAAFVRQWLRQQRKQPKK